MNRRDSSSQSLRPATQRLEPGSLAQLIAALLWLPQAAWLALSVQRMASGGGMSEVLAPAGGILLLGLMRAGLQAWGTRRIFKRARRQLSDLRVQVAQALASRSPLDRARAASGLAASVIAEQAEAVVPYWVRYQPVRLRVMVLPLLIALVISTLSWAAALGLLLAAPLIPLFMALVGARAKAASQAQMVEMGGMNAFLLDRLRGLGTLRALDAVDATALRLGEAAQSLRRRTMAVLRIAFLSSAVLELLAALGVAMVAVYVGFHLLGSFEFGAWGRRLSLGQGMFILLLAPAFFEPLRDLSAVWHDRAAGEAALDSLDQMSGGGVALPGIGMGVGTSGNPSSGQVGARARIDPDFNAVGGSGGGVGATNRVPASVAASARSDEAFPSSAPSVRVRQLDFSHPGEPPVFQRFALEVASGERVALVGGSGTGKTTLLSLLAGLAPAAAGEIAIGGTVLSDATASALRRRIGWMGQKPHVFAGSVQANVALGRPGIEATQVEAAVQFAALEQVAQAHPGTELGEGGSGLSGGEAVRLALARVAADPGVGLLLVDEPTAHLDTATAERVADALVLLARGKTLIVATHDPVLAARMDRVIQLTPIAQENSAISQHGVLGHLPSLLGVASAGVEK